MKEQIVLSLFNGMNTLRQAMENVGIPVKKYYSSEIKPYAIKLTQHHFPDTIQLGDITKWREWDIDWSEITFIGSGSPCQDLSAAGRQNGINGSRSKLFFTFIEILNHCRKLNPNVLFLQENVGSANTFDVGIMSRELGLYPVRINSELVTAQLRDRYYWTNIKIKQTMFDTVTDIPTPEDRKIYLKDIIENGYVLRDKSNALLESDYKCFVKDQVKENILIQKRIKKGKQTPVLVYLAKNNVRTVSTVEMCRLQGFPDNYCDILSKSQAASLLGDGWTLPVIEHILSFYKAERKTHSSRSNF